VIILLGFHSQFLYNEVNLRLIMQCTAIVLQIIIAFNLVLLKCLGIIIDP